MSKENNKDKKMNAEEISLEYAEKQAAQQNAANIPPAKTKSTEEKK
ncbi:hypothetical protein [Bacillus sp. AFS017336]|nr:hypothetical protein [Bacillus sp. AFS017336]